jgi:predicted metal-dependent hydrolase
MTHIYDALMDHLAALAVEAVQRPVMAVQAYWLVLMAHQESSLSSPTLSTLLQQSREATTLPMPAWAQPLALQALGRLLRDGIWLETSASLTLPQVCSCTDLASSSQAVVCWRTVYQPYVDEIRDQVCRLWQAACHLYGPLVPGLAALPEEVRRGVILFETGFYFACHEYFETLWGRTEDVASDLYQGIIQVAVAIRHLESHNVRGAILLLRSGMGRLQRYPTVYKGLDLAAWLERLETLLEQLETLSASQAYHFDPKHVPHLLNLKLCGG